MNINNINQVNLDTRKIEVLYNQSTVAILASVTAAGILSLAFWTILPTNIMPAWLGIFFAIVVLRMLVYFSFRKSFVPIHTTLAWLYLHYAGIVAAGIMWGIFGYIALEYSDVTYSALITMAIGGLAAGALATYSTSLLSYILFATPAMFPLIVYLLESDNPSLHTMGFLAAIFYIFMLVSSWYLTRHMTKSLAFELVNNQLLAQLKEEKENISSLNDELQQDIQKRIQTEENLLNERKKVEQLVEKLMELSTRDSLTGICNRREFDESLNKEWSRSIRTGSTLSLIMCDIDYFKGFNDLYGHQDGDKCLTRIAHLLEDYARRGGDLATRYGGEEFAIILPDTDGDDAYHIAEQMRIAIEELRIPHADSKNNEIVTASFGVATITPSRHQFSQLLVKTADEALYKSKAEGRNQTTLKVIDTKPNDNPDQA